MYTSLDPVFDPYPSFTQRVRRGAVVLLRSQVHRGTPSVIPFTVRLVTSLPSREPLILCGFFVGALTQKGKEKRRVPVPKTKHDQ